METLLEDPRRDAFTTLLDTARILRTHLDQRARDHGTTRAQWGVLGRLCREEGLTQAELAEMLDIQPISLTRLVDKLDAQGLVERRPHPTDRRANRLFLTPEGRTAAEAFAPLALDVFDEIFAGLDAAEIAELAALIGRMRCNIRRSADTTAAEVGAVAHG